MQRGLFASCSCRSIILPPSLSSLTVLRPTCAQAVRDVVMIPEGVPPGKYILGFRYDCEATAQVMVELGKHSREAVSLLFVSTAFVALCLLHVVTVQCLWRRPSLPLCFHRLRD